MRDETRAWFRRRGLMLGPGGKESVRRIVKDIDAMNFKMRCLMAQGGYKFMPEGMKPEQARENSDSLTTEVANFIVMLRCAESVIVRHGLTAEYRARVEVAQQDLTDSIKAKITGLFGVVQRVIDREGKAEMRRRVGLEPGFDPMGVVMGDAAEGERTEDSGGKG